MWVHDVIIPRLSHKTWYNMEIDRQKNVISDGVGYLVGNARMRLLRVKKGNIKIIFLIRYITFHVQNVTILHMVR